MNQTDFNSYYASQSDLDGSSLLQSTNDSSAAPPSATTSTNGLGLSVALPIRTSHIAQESLSSLPLTSQDSSGDPVTVPLSDVSNAERASPEDKSGRRRKAPVPESNKNEKYWEKRKRNNEAARKSRELKRSLDSDMKANILRLQEQIDDMNKTHEELKRKLGVDQSVDMKTLVEGLPIFSLPNYLKSKEFAFPMPWCQHPAAHMNEGGIMQQPPQHQLLPSNLQSDLVDTSGPMKKQRKGKEKDESHDPPPEMLYSQPGGYYNSYARHNPVLMQTQSLVMPNIPQSSAGDTMSSAMPGGAINWGPGYSASLAGTPRYYAAADGYGLDPYPIPPAGSQITPSTPSRDQNGMNAS